MRIRDEARRRAVDAAAHAAHEILADLGLVHVLGQLGHEPRDVEAEKLRVPTEAAVVERMLILEQQVVHRPELALRARRFRRLGGTQRVGIIEDLDVETPEEVTATHELQSCVDAALAGLPEEWRRAVTLYHVEELSGDELARALGKSRSESEQLLEHARAYLRQRLTESACLPRS